MFVDRRPFPTASGSLNFDFGKEYGRTPQVWAEGGVLKAPALEGIKEETMPPNQEHEKGGDFRFNGVYYQPWARDVKPLFQGSRMTPPLNYNRLPVGAEHLKRGVDRGGTMIDEEGKLVHVANYASNFKLKGNSAQELRRSFLLQSLENLNNKPSIRARNNILKELKERGFYAPGDENRSLADLKQKVSDNAGRNGMSENPWTEDPVFHEIMADIEQADETQLSTMLQQQEAMMRELQQLNQNQQYERSTDTSTDTSDFPNISDIQFSDSGSVQPETGFGAQQQGGQLDLEEEVMKDQRTIRESIPSQQEVISDVIRGQTTVGLPTPPPRDLSFSNESDLRFTQTNPLRQPQNLGYDNEIHPTQPSVSGNDLTARSSDSNQFFSPARSERELRQRQQQTTGQGGNTVETGQEQEGVASGDSQLVPPLDESGNPIARPNVSKLFSVQEDGDQVFIGPAGGIQESQQKNASRVREPTNLPEATRQRRFLERAQQRGHLNKAGIKKLEKIREKEKNYLAKY
jgi:hypothetical protein